ncbi:MAG: N-acetylmuramoyl-L-alanine amidase [Solirubrobacterales bacterium]|nr:N-acetylmuramoyl-L-alanine amidase [Solirubrobacterales bacterium]
MSIRIVSRREWGSQFGIPGNRHFPSSQWRWFVVHWPGSAVGNDERAVVRSIERQHRNLGWAAAPGYGYLVGRSGTIYEGVGLLRGIHSPPRNADGIGVCVMIAPGEQIPQATRNATRALYEWICARPGARRLGITWHGQHFATACPGPVLTQWARNGMPAQGGAPAPSQPSGGGGGGFQTRSAPPWGGRLLRQPPILRIEAVRTWQARMRERRWPIEVDGAYGPESQRMCTQMQRNLRLQVDGIVGPETWRATFERPLAR